MNAARSESVGRSALLVAAVTALARLTGFARQLVFQATVGATLVGTVYATSNYVPNVMFEIVAGGALAALVVPLIAVGIVARDPESARATAATLLGWALLVLVPMAVLVAMLAEPMSRALLAGAGGDLAVDVASDMLRIFAGQVPLYAVAVITAGVLQAHGRFGAAAAGPLVSSGVVVLTYVVFAGVFGGDRDDLTTLDATSLIVLAGGTTLGVLALALTTLVPCLRAGLLARPSLRFAPGLASRARVLAGTGVLSVLAQQAALLVAIPVANGRGGPGALVTFQYAWMLFLLPFAVLAVPLATSAFPRLSRAAEQGARDDFDATAAWALRAVARTGALGCAMLVAAAVPLAAFFGLIGSGKFAEDQMAWALVGFAPGLLGYGLLTVLGRALVAMRFPLAAAVGTALGWLTTAALSLVATAFVAPAQVVATLAAAHSAGLTLGAVLLAVALRRRVGAGPLSRVPRTATLAMVAATAGGSAGYAIANILSDALAADPPSTVIAGGSAAAVAAVVCLGVLVVADANEVGPLLKRLTGRSPAAPTAAEQSEESGGRGVQNGGSRPRKLEDER